MKNLRAHLAIAFSMIIGCLPNIAFPSPIVEVHGSIRLDIQFNDRIPQYFPGVPFAEAISVPTDDLLQCQHNQTLLDTRLTRFDITASYLDLCYVKLFGAIEVDFLNETAFTTEPRALIEAPQAASFFLVNGDGRFLNNFVPRLRLAYVHMDICDNWRITTGQYWTQFTSLNLANPEILDEVGPAGYTVVRQPQLAINYTWFLNCMGKLQFVVSAEKQALSRLDKERLTHFHPTQQDENQGYCQPYPLFVARAGWYGFKPFQFEIAGTGTKDCFVELLSSNPRLAPIFPFYKKAAWGSQITVQSQWCDLTLFGRFRYLNGVNRLGGTEFPDIVLQSFSTSAPSILKTVRSYGGFIGLTYEFTPCTSITGIFGETRAHAVPFSTFSDAAVGRVRSYQLDIIHWFWKRFRIGGEFKRWEVKEFNGDVKGHLDIAAMALCYYF